MEFKVFLDTNIFLDHLQDRNVHSIEILKLCEQRVIEGYASASCFYALAYFVGKYTKADIRKTLENYSEIVELIPTTKENLYGAYQSGFKDMEDAFQYFTARNKANIDFFITNNIKDFKHTDKKLKVISASEFLKLLSNEE